VAEKICDVWLPVVSNLPRISIPLMNTLHFFPALIRLISALMSPISALMSLPTTLLLTLMNPFFPFFPAFVRPISALLRLISPQAKFRKLDNFVICKIVFEIFLTGVNSDSSQKHCALVKKLMWISMDRP